MAKKNTPWEINLKADKLKVYKRLIAPIDWLAKWENVAICFLASPYYAIRLLETHPNIKITIIDTKNVKFIYESLKHNKKYSKRCNIIYIEDYVQKIEKIFIKLGMKFDCIIMNPPYQGNLHLKILAEARNHLNDDDSKCIDLSPSRWLQDPLAKYKKTSDYNKFEKTISKYIQSLQIFEPAFITKLFGGEGSISMSKEVGIYVIGKNPGNFKYDRVFTKRGNCDFSVFDKLAKYCNGLPWKEYGKSDKNIFVRVRRMASSHRERGEGRIPELFGNLNLYGVFVNGKYNNKTLAEIQKADPHATRGRAATTRIVEFKSADEAKNFIASCNTKIYKYIVLGCTPAEEIDLNHLPWLGDAVNPRTGLKGYFGEWTDEDLYKYFELTDDQIKIVEDTIKKYAAK